MPMTFLQQGPGAVSAGCQVQVGEQHLTSCMRSYSVAIGSLTFKINSACCQTSSGLDAILAPAAANSSSVMEEPMPRQTRR